MIYLSETGDGKNFRREVSLPHFDIQVDLAVCGLGTAGSLAALFSAENGLSVLGIEAFTCLGGTHKNFLNDTPAPKPKQESFYSSKNSAKTKLRPFTEPLCAVFTSTKIRL